MDLADWRGVARVLLDLTRHSIFSELERCLSNKPNSIGQKFLSSTRTRTRAQLDRLDELLPGMKIIELRNSINLELAGYLSEK
jgi:hypothetical protein